MLKGYNILLQTAESLYIPGLDISPTGVAEKLVISTEVDFVKKKKLCRDLLFRGAISDKSENSRFYIDRI